MIVKAFRPVKIAGKIVPPDTEFEAPLEVVERLREAGAGISVIAEGPSVKNTEAKPKVQAKPKAKAKAKK